MVPKSRRPGTHGRTHNAWVDVRRGPRHREGFGFRVPLDFGCVATGRFSRQRDACFVGTPALPHAANASEVARAIARACVRAPCLRCLVALTGSVTAAKPLSIGQKLP